MEPLFKIHESEVPYRFDGISGPKYLLRGPRADFGLVILQPGEDFNTHYHRKLEENFYTLEGCVEIFIKDQHMVLEPGDLCHVPPLHPHYLINRGDTRWLAVFAKSPYDAADKVDVSWRPGDPPLMDVE